MRAKLKTCKAVSRRVKITGSGQMLYHRSGRRHLLTGKASKRMRPLRRGTVLSRVEVERIKKLLPYGT